jgi:hypothetical protein
MRDNKCLICKLSNFGNLYYEKTDREGGELYVLDKSIESNKLLPCHLTWPLDATFDLWKEVYHSLNENLAPEELPPILFSAWQSLFDLKASVFLSLAAHYRSAIQILRPILENIIISIYFQEKIRRAKDKRKLKKEYENYIIWSEEANNTIDFNSSLQDLVSTHIINANEERRINELMETMNNYLHSYMFRWDRGNTPEAVCYDEGRLDEWLDMYQNVLGYLIEKLCHYFPNATRTQNGQNALIELKGMELLEKDLKKTLIKSKNLKDFLSQISLDGKLPLETGCSSIILDLPYLDESSDPR